MCPTPEGLRGDCHSSKYEDKSRFTPRRRAARACLGCRTRKVRCDVTVKGSPCTNCTLDSIQCFVKPRRRQGIERELFRPRPGVVQEQQRTDGAPEPEDEQADYRESPICPSEDEALASLSTGHDSLSLYNNTESFPEIMQGEFDDLIMLLNQGGLDKSTAVDISADSSVESNEPSEYAEIGIQVLRTQQDLAPASDKPTPTNTSISLQNIDKRSDSPGCNFIPLSSYPFVSSDMLWCMEQEDMNYLESKGCLRLPVKPALDEFIKQYFLYVHPTFLLLNEADFWMSYKHQYAETEGPGKVSLLIVQAMLFMASPVISTLASISNVFGVDSLKQFVSNSTLQFLGLLSVQQARSCFYNRCKTLFHLDASTDDLTKAQCALMLTYHAATINDRTSSYWLATAIHYAKIAEADLYQESNHDFKTRITLKRMWWCCILRDRIMALGLRRSLQIQPTDFDFQQQGLREEDMSDEIRNSEVYDAPTKKVLLQVATSLCELAVILNDILILCYPSQKATSISSDNLHTGIKVLREQAHLLDTWYEISVEKYRMADATLCMHKSLGLFINALSIYYFAAKVSLFHKVMTLSFSNPTNSAIGPYTVLHASDEINESLKNIIESLKDLEHRDLTRYLPNTFVAFSVLPLQMHVDSNMLREDSPLGQSRDNTNLYTKLFTRFHKLYEMTGSVLVSIGYTAESLGSSST